MLRASVIVALAAIALCLAGERLAADGGKASGIDEVISKSEKIYAEAGHFSAKFRQSLSGGGFFEDETTSGVMIIGYPDRFRIESPEQTLVSDGDSLWSYSVENKQVTIEAMNDLNALVTPADYLFRFKEHYEVRSDTLVSLEGKKAYKLHLLALAKDEIVKELDLYIDSSSYLIVRAAYRDPNDNLVTLDFSDWKLKIKTQPDDFRFQTPSGVEEIRVP